MPCSNTRSANIGSAKVASTTSEARPDNTGNSISSLSERSTAALDFTSPQLRDSVSNMIGHPLSVCDAGARASGWMVAADGRGAQ